MEAPLSGPFLNTRMKMLNPRKGLLLSGSLKV